MNSLPQTTCNTTRWGTPRYHMEVDKLTLKLDWLSLETMAFSFKYLRCNDSQFRMGVLEWHQSQMVDTFKKDCGINPISPTNYDQ